MKFTKTHEWVKQNGDLIIMGITNHAQRALSDIVFIDFPPVSKKVKQNEFIFPVEWVKVVSEINSPVDGEVVEVNKNLISAPELANESLESDGWMIKIKCDSDFDWNSLMTEEEDKKFLGENE